MRLIIFNYLIYLIYHAARAQGSSEADLVAQGKRIEEQVKDHDASMEVMAKSQQAGRFHAPYPLF